MKQRVGIECRVLEMIVNSCSAIFFSEFLNIALGLLDECYRTNEDVAQQLLTYNLDNWGDQCCLSLAVATGHEEFVAHTCCQTLLSEIWMGAMKMGEWASLKVTNKHGRHSFSPPQRNTL